MIRALLGITTLNRAAYLSAILESFRETASPRIDWVIAVADDGSSDGTEEILRRELRSRRIDMVAWNSHAGVCRQKNCLLALANAIDADFTFLADDDVVFRQMGWDSAYMAAMHVSGFGHLVHFDESWGGKSGTRATDGLPLRWTVPVLETQGAFLTLNRTARQAAGYFDERNFWGRGWGHRDFTRRLALAGQHPQGTSADHADGPWLLGLQPRETYVRSIPHDQRTDEYRANVAPGEQSRRRGVVEARSMTHLSVDDAADPSHHSRFEGTGPWWTLHAHELASIGLGAAVDPSSEHPTEAWVINLERERDRWVAMNGWRACGLELRRVPAADGMSPAIESDWRTYAADPAWTDFDRRLGRRAISSAGALAYIRTWRHLISAAKHERRRHVLVMDDDTIPHVRYESMVRAAVRELPEDWMLLYLGFTQRKDHPPVPVTPCLTHPMASVDGSFAVMVSSRAFDQLLELLTSELAPVDAGALRELDRRNPMKVFALKIPAVIADVSTSSIRGPRSMAEHAAKAGWDLSQYGHRVPTSRTANPPSRLHGAPMRAHRALHAIAVSDGAEVAFRCTVDRTGWSERDRKRFAIRWPHIA